MTSPVLQPGCYCLKLILKALDKLSTLFVFTPPSTVQPQVFYHIFNFFSIRSRCFQQFVSRLLVLFLGADIQLVQSDEQQDQYNYK
jgi:hypothetical protein